MHKILELNVFQRLKNCDTKKTVAHYSLGTSFKVEAI